MRPLRILIAPSGYKECLSAEAVADAIAVGISRASSAVDVVALPLADGGEGFVRTLTLLTGGSLRQTQVLGPLGEPVSAEWGMLGGTVQPTAVIEAASAAGLGLVPMDRRDPCHTRTDGVGQLIAAALDAEATRIIVGCGDSGTNDAGAGMAGALGARFLTLDERLVKPGGVGLLELHELDVSGIDPRIAGVHIEVACNMHNVLCGEQGVSAVYAPQKGASPQGVAQLGQAMDIFASVVEATLGIDVRTMPGGGASGGLGAGLKALLGAHFLSRSDLIDRYFDLDAQLANVDLVFTAEGRIDRQSAAGKIPCEVGVRARRLGIPVIAIAGTIGAQAEITYQHGITAYFSTLARPSTLDDAIAVASEQIADCTENVMRAMLATMTIAERASARRDAASLPLLRS